MKKYYYYHSAGISEDKFYFPGTFVIHYKEQMEDESRNGIKEKYLFDGISICFFIFELIFGVKIYEAI